MMRRVVAGLLFAALVAGGVRLSILRLLLPPHRPPAAPAPGAALHRWPLRFMDDPTPPEIARFFAGVRANTKPGERIALLMPPPREGLGYTYWRASYDLTGRPMMLPVIIQDPKDADVIAIWDTYYGYPGFEPVWISGKGALLRRTR